MPSNLDESGSPIEYLKRFKRKKEQQQLSDSLM